MLNIIFSMRHTIIKKVIMILFLEDWKRHPTAVPDYSTTNKSWVRLAGVYHKMGVTNCLFHLALHNRALQGVDPHSNNLTTEQIAMIAEEAAENPWYVLREIIRVPPIAGVNSLPLRGNRGNISVYWLFFNHITTMLIQPRQTGKSISVDALMICLLSVLTVNTDISLLTKDDSLRVKNIKRLKDLIEHLPAYFQLKTRKDSNNTEKITLERLGNTYLTAVAQASKKAAIKLGRGMTNAINHIDEIAFINNIKTTLPALLASSGAARDSAKEVNAPYGNLFTTTPGYLATESGEFAHNIYNESFRWSELLYDSNDLEDLEKHIKMNCVSGKLQVICDFNHRQLGYTDEWLRSKIAEAMASGEAAEADFLGIWPGGSGGTLIPKDKLKIITASRVVDPALAVSSYGYIVRWYIPLSEIANHLIVAGLDTSEAVGKDGIGLVLRDVSTGAVLGSGDFNETNTITFSRWLADFLMEYPNITLIPERKSTGMSIIDALIEILLHNNIDPFKRIFNWVVNDSRVKAVYLDEVVNVPMRMRDASVYIKYRKQFGYTTTGVGRSSRTMLYGEIFNASISYTADTVRDTKLINQLLGLIVKNNRIDHSSDNNDDLVIAWLLAHWVLAKGENLDFYGMPKHKVLTSVAETIVEEQGGREAIDIRTYQLELKSEIDKLVDKIKDERSPVRRKMLVAKLKYLYNDIDSNIIQSFNIDTLLDSLDMDKARGYRR